VGGNPHGAVFILLLFPDGHYLFQGINDKLAGGKGLGAVGGSYGHYYGYIANGQGAFAVHYGHFLQHGPAFLGLLGYEPQLMQGHGIVGFVVQAYHPAAGALVAHRANKRIHGAGTSRLPGLEHGGYLKGLIGKFNKHKQKKQPASWSARDGY
jgi:hypothetical protein